MTEVGWHTTHKQSWCVAQEVILQQWLDLVVYLCSTWNHRTNETQDVEKKSKHLNHVDVRVGTAHSRKFCSQSTDPARRAQTKTRTEQHSVCWTDSAFSPDWRAASTRIMSEWFWNVKWSDTMKGCKGDQLLMGASRLWVTWPVRSILICCPWLVE